MNIDLTPCAVTPCTRLIPWLALIFTLANAINTHALQPPAVSPNDELFALHDGLIRELRRGGYVIYMRHGPTQPSQTDIRGPGEWWKNCATTQQTSAAALPTARLIGEALTKQRIVISDIQTSEFCRAFDTGVFLGLITPKRNPALNAISAFASQNRTLADQAAGIINLISTVPPVGQNRLLVGHALSPTIIHPLFAHLQEGHTLVFKPEGNSRFHLVAELSPAQWQFIGRQIVADQPNFVVQASIPQGSASVVNAGAPQVIQPPTQIPANQPPVIDPARELKGTALITALRRGGYNLYMRHASATIGTDQDLLKVPMWWQNCAIQRNISDLGREHAKKVGTAMRELNLPIATVKTSQFCRVRDTAITMALDPVEITEALNHQIGQREGTDVNELRFKLLATMPPTGKNILLISHTHSSARNEERVMAGIQEAEVVVFQPDGNGGTEPVARIPMAEWDNLLLLATSTTNTKAK